MSYISIAQLAISVIIVGLILLQERESGLSGLFGGGDMGGSVYQTRRGLEKWIFIATIVCAIVFVGLSVASLILK